MHEFERIDISLSSILHYCFTSFTEPFLQYFHGFVISQRYTDSSMLMYEEEYMRWYLLDIVCDMTLLLSCLVLLLSAAWGIWKNPISPGFTSVIPWWPVWVSGPRFGGHETLRVENCCSLNGFFKESIYSKQVFHYVPETPLCSQHRVFLLPLFIYQTVSSWKQYPHLVVILLDLLPQFQSPR